MKKKLDAGTKIAITTGTMIVLAVVIAATAYIVHTVSSHKKAGEIREYGATLDSSQWKEVFQNCEQLHKEYIGKAKEFIALPFGNLPKSIQAFGFQHKLAGKNAVVFIYSGGNTSNSIDLQYVETPEKSWILKFDNKQVHPPLTP